MATFYGTALGETINALPTASKKVAKAGLGGARVRTKVFQLTVPVGHDMTTNDVIRMGTIPSGDRIGDIRLSSTALTATAPIVDVGLYLAGTNHDGAVVDADLFVDDLTLSAQDQTDAFTEATTLIGADRWKFAWELAAIGAGSDTTDPRVEYDLCILVTNTSSAQATADGQVVIEVDYISGT